MMASSQTLYSITITNSNSTSPPNDGFVDNLTIEDYYWSASTNNPLMTTPSGLTYALCKAKVRGNMRYRDIISQLGMVTNCYVTENAIPYNPSNEQTLVYGGFANTTSSATATAEATSFVFYIIVEHGDASLSTPDEYNAGQFLTSTACIQRCVGRALLNDMYREVAVFDPTDTESLGTYGSTTSVIRYGTRIITGFECAPYASSISNSNGCVAVAKITF
jgi:hypothetical protein